MAGFWDMVGKAANLLQLFGVDAITLINLVASCFWQFHEVEKECRKLEDSVRMLEELLLSPAVRWIMQQQNMELLEHLVTKARKDADDLVRSCRSPYLRVLRGRDMSRQFDDLRNSIDFYCRLILLIIVVVVVQANPPPPTPPPPSSLVRAQVNHVGEPPSPGDSTSTSSSTAAPDHTHIIDLS